MESKYSSEWETSQVSRFEKILDVNISKLLREDSTEFNFLEIKEKVKFVIEQVSLLAQNFKFWAQLSDSKRAGIISSIDDMTTQFTSMLEFDPKQNNAWDTRNNLVANFNNRYNTFYDSLISDLNAFLGSTAYSSELTTEFGKRAKKELDDIRSVKKSIDAIQKQVSDAASIAGGVASASFSQAFNSQASKHEDSANKWLRALIIGGLISGVIATTVIVDIVKTLDKDSLVSSSESYVLKIVLLAFLYIGIKFIIKNYSANKHLEVINQQRANVLSTLEAFRSSALGDESKDAVLLAGVAAAYSQQETGFITKNEGAGNDDSSFSELANILKK